MIVHDIPLNLSASSLDSCQLPGDIFHAGLRLDELSGHNFNSAFLIIGIECHIHSLLRYTFSVYIVFSFALCAGVYCFYSVYSAEAVFWHMIV